MPKPVDDEYTSSWVHPSNMDGYDPEWADTTVVFPHTLPADEPKPPAKRHAADKKES